MSVPQASAFAFQQVTVCYMFLIGQGEVLRTSGNVCFEGAEGTAPSSHMHTVTHTHTHMVVSLSHSEPPTISRALGFGCPGEKGGGRFLVAFARCQAA